MKLKYILGRPGTGKTKSCIDEISKIQNSYYFFSNSAAFCHTTSIPNAVSGTAQYGSLGEEIVSNAAKPLIYIVPEQFSLQSEKDLIASVNNSVLFGAQVLSFKRLAFRVFSEVSGVNKNILEEIGKVMLLRKIVYEIKDDLAFFKTSVDKQGFLENLSTAVSEFFRYNITPDILNETIQNILEKNNLYLKLTDLQKIYKCFLEYIKEKYISTDETLDILANKIGESAELEGALIWIDGFTGFTPQEYKVINELFKKAAAVTITMTVNSMTNDVISPADPFFETKYTLNKLNRIAAENNISPETVFLSERFCPLKSLKFLETNYFNYMAAPCRECSNINIFAAKNNYSEIMKTAGDIVGLVRDNGYMYRDIAIITGSPDYEKQIRGIFKQFDIPFFMDTKKDISSHPLTELICALLDIIITGWSYESVFRFLKTGLTPICGDDTELLENYVLAFGIKGRRWYHGEWKYGFDRNSEFNETDINNIKDCIVNILTPLTSEIKSNKKYTVKEISIKIFELLYNINVPDVLSLWISDAKQDNDNLTAHEHSQIWGLITAVFEKMVEIIGDAKVSVYEYLKVLKAGVSKCGMGLIPPADDRVIVGDLQRTRLPNIKALFILGANDGAIPSSVSSGGIFSDTDRTAMAKYGAELSGGKDRKVGEEQFLIYSALTKPSEFLFLSYATGSIDGRHKRPSPIISRLKTLFPDLKEVLEESLTADNINNITTPKPTFERMGTIMSDYIRTGEMPPIYKDALGWFNNDEKYSTIFDKITHQRLISNKKSEYLTGEACKKLYGKTYSSSVSQLESFMRCPFSFFMQYGLKLKQRKLYQIKPPDMGNIFHKILEDFSKEIDRGGIAWRELNKHQIDGMVEASAEKLTGSMGNEILLSSERYKYLLKKIKRIAKRSVWALSEHIKRGMFEPFGYEIGFGGNEKLPPIIIELSSGSKIVLTGKIDRIDILDCDGKKYVKIIDYKSGNIKYDLQEIYYGIQLQLALYLDAFIKSFKEISNEELLPGGMFYFKINDPLLNLESVLSDNEIENTLLKEFKVSGLVLDDEIVINALDNERKGHSPIVPIQFSKDGLGGKSSVASAENFEALRNFVYETVKDIGGDIIKGNIKTYPYKKKDRTACDFCLYKSVCRFEKATMNYRIIEPLENPWDLMLFPNQ